MSYLDLEMQECEEPTNIKAIEQLESFINAKLPEEYKQFLLKYNGGRPTSRDCFPLIEYINGCKRTGSAAMIEWFFDLYNGEHNNIVNHYTSVHKGRVPSHMIIIARGCSSDMICLDTKEGANYGKIYYSVHMGNK